jgi:hypothetical protein
MVRDMIRSELACDATSAAARGDMMFVTRRTVLGRWRQRKRELYEQYVQAVAPRER